jgi:Tol biopolymer transport system component
MSPEQARALPVDRRTDIWAFGCMLFEMLSSHRPFEGETLSDTVARILEREPDWSKLPRDTPPALRKLVERCLRKDVRRRLHDIADARIDLEDVDLTAGPADGGDAVASGTRKRPWINWVAALAGGTAVGIAAASLYLRTPAPPPAPAPAPIEFSVSPPPGAVFYRHFEVSPDGRKIVVAATTNGVSQLWVRPTTGPAWRQVAGTEDARFPFWSPDNQSIGFFARGQLKTVKLDGTPPFVVCDCNVQGNFAGGSWNHEGVILFSGMQYRPIYKIKSTGGSPIPMSSGRDSVHVWPSFLPDGDHFLYIERRDLSVLRVASLSSPDDVVVGAFDSHVTYADGHLLFVRKGWLMAQPFDARTRTITGDAIVIADHSNESVRPRGDFSASPAGVLARLAPSEGRRLTWVSRTGATLGTIGAPGEYRNLSLSRDGRTLAVSIVTKPPGDEAANYDIWHFDLERAGTPTRLTHDPDEDVSPTFSPDGSQIAFESNRIGRPHNLFTRRITGAENVPVLAGFESPVGGFAPDWSEDGRWLVFDAGGDLWKLALTGDRQPSGFLRTRFVEMRAAISPDGRWIAFESNQSGETEVYVRPFPEGDGEIKISSGGGRSVAWSRDGREIFFIAPDGTMMSVSKIGEGKFRASTPKELFRTDLNWFGGNKSYAVARDGRFLLTVPVNAAGNPRPIEIVLNWTAKPRREQP